MAAKIGRLLGSEELYAKFRALGEAVQAETLETAVLAGGTVLLNAARKNIKDQKLIKTRTLSRSLHQEITERSATRVVAEVGTDAPYAAIYEYGGTIRPKASKYLSIPVGDRMGSPRNYADMSVRKSGAGNLVLVDESGKAQFVLVSSVDVEARPYLRPAWDAEQEAISSQIGDVVKKLVEKAAG